MTRLHVLLGGEHLGMLDGAGRHVRFTYDRDLDPAHTIPLSLSMPLTRPRYRGPILRQWLSALLPDRPPLLARWRAQFGVTDLNPERLLAHMGGRSPAPPSSSGTTASTQFWRGQGP